MSTRRGSGQHRLGRSRAGTRPEEVTPEEGSRAGVAQAGNAQALEQQVLYVAPSVLSSRVRPGPGSGTKPWRRGETQACAWQRLHAESTAVFPCSRRWSPTRCDDRNGIMSWGARLPRLHRYTSTWPQRAKGAPVLRGCERHLPGAWNVGSAPVCNAYHIQRVGCHKPLRVSADTLTPLLMSVLVGSVKLPTIPCAAR